MNVKVILEYYQVTKTEYEKIRELEETKDSKKQDSNVVKKIFKTATGVQGIQDRNSAKNIKKACENIYNAASKVTEAKRNELNEMIVGFGKIRLNSLKKTVGRFLGYLKDMDQKNKTKEYEILGEIGLDVKTIEHMETLEMGASKALTSTAIAGALGAAAAMGTPALVTGAVTAIGTASTNAAIVTLAGAAKTNAILAWLGGGSLATGGGGIAAGTTVLAGITAGATAGVAILAAGMMASTHYAKKLTEAKEYQKSVEIAVAEMEKAWIIMDGILQRTQEMSMVTLELEIKALKQLEYLEPLTVEFDTDNDYYNKIFQRNGLLIKSMSELAQTPLLDNECNISPESAQIISKTYSVLNTEITNHE
jgi:hypothetical protein